MFPVGEGPSLFGVQREVSKAASVGLMEMFVQQTLAGGAVCLAGFRGQVITTFMHPLLYPDAMVGEAPPEAMCQMGLLALW